MKYRNLHFAMAGSLLILSALSCSKSNGNDGNSTPTPITPPSGVTTLNIYNMAFPASTTIKKGTTVTWYNQDSFAHTVTSDDGISFSSGNLASGATFSFTPSKAGTFDYHCNIHSNMKGKLIVTD